MKCPIQSGELNKWHFCVLATVAMKLLNSLTIGIFPVIETSEKKMFLFGRQPIFSNHPFIQSSYYFFGIFFFGLISYFLKKIIENKIYKEEGLLEIKKKNEKFIGDNNRVNVNNQGLLIKNIFIILIFVLALITVSIYDNLGFNQVKLWPIEYLFLIFFSKKILNRILYKHQKLVLIIILIVCDIGRLTESFIPDDNSKCDEKSENYDNCILLNENSYGKIMHQLGWVFIPIIFILYLISMLANSYGTVKIKYLTDFKFIDIYIISVIIGILGFLISIISVIIFTYKHCDVKNTDIHIEDICKLKNDNFNYFDSLFIYFQSFTKSSDFYFEILSVLFFQVVNFFDFLFSLLIIKKLDPFYLIPSRCLYFLIYSTIKYFLAIPYTTKLLTIKYLFDELSNIIAVICSLIYLEIIILNFCNYEKDVKERIIERGEIEVEKANEKEKEPSKIEITIDENYTVEI